MALPKDGNTRQEARSVGRPTKFKEEYCDLIISHMAKGFSYESFAGLVSVDTDTLYNWEKLFPQFSESKRVAFQKCRLWWEEAGINGMFMGGKDNPFQAAIWVYNMKCRFREHWTEKKELEVKANVVSFTPEQAKAELDALREMVKEEV